MHHQSDDVRLNSFVPGLTRRTTLRVQTLALYGSLALIAAVVFGSLSVHPF
jgi:hypothetical protein